MAIAAIVGVLVFTAILIALLWSAVKSSECAERDPLYRRRVLLFMAGIYVVGAITGIGRVLARDAPLWSLAFLPIPVLFAYLWLKAARGVRIPTNKT